MFIYCEKCNWTQDDFWSKEGYNPFDFLEENHKEDLFGGNLDKVYYLDKNDSFGKFIGTQPITGRQHIATSLRHWADKIEKQRYISYEQYRTENPDRKCPICKGHLIED